MWIYSGQATSQHYTSSIYLITLKPSCSCWMGQWHAGPLRPTAGKGLQAAKANSSCSMATVAEEIMGHGCIITGEQGASCCTLMMLLACANLLQGRTPAYFQKLTLIDGNVDSHACVMRRQAATHHFASDNLPRS